jgi:hypothetical protein
MQESESYTKKRKWLYRKVPLNGHLFLLLLLFYLALFPFFIFLNLDESINVKIQESFFEQFVNLLFQPGSFVIVNLIDALPFLTLFYFLFLFIYVFLMVVLFERTISFSVYFMLKLFKSGRQ